MVSDDPRRTAAAGNFLLQIARSCVFIGCRLAKDARAQIAGHQRPRFGGQGRLKLSLKPRTPTSAATPTATESTTNANFPGADFRSRQAMAAARFQLKARLAIFAARSG